MVVAWYSSRSVRSSSSVPRNIRIVSLLPPTAMMSPKATLTAAHTAPSWGRPPTKKATNVGTATEATSTGVSHSGTGLRDCAFIRPSYGLPSSKTCSTVASKYRASARASGSDGMYRPVSIELIV